MNPFDGMSDEDGDGLPRAWEVYLGTNPNLADTDGDGYSDSEEVLIFNTDPLDPASKPEHRSKPSRPSAPQTIAISPRIAVAAAPAYLTDGGFSGITVTKWTTTSKPNYYQGTFEYGVGTDSATGWSAYRGSGIEVWKPKTGGKSFVELDNSAGNYGIKQAIKSPVVGSYLLYWKQCGRDNPAAERNAYHIRVYYMQGTTKVEVAKYDVFTDPDKKRWTDKLFAFQITSIPANAKFHVAFIPNGKNNSYGTLIDDVSLVPVDLDIVHPATGELEEGKQHDAMQGGIVAIRRDDQTPVTELVIRQSGGLPSGAKFKLQFNQADRFRVWKDKARVWGVTSELTEFDPASENTLYLEGMKPSSVRGGEEIKLQVIINGTLAESESVKFTVTAAEFDVFARAFIPYQWVAVPVVWGPSTIVAHGDDRNYDLSLAGTFRRQNIVTIIPFEELSKSPIKQVRLSDGTTFPLESATCGESKHFDKVTSLPNPACVFVHEGEAACPNNRLFTAALADEVEGLPYMVKRVTASTDNMHTLPVSIANHVAKVKIDSSASEPILAIAASIDYTFDVEIDSSDPLVPKYRLSGKQDGFPAYEVYVMTQKKRARRMG